MTISQTQIVDYLNKKLGYGVAKTDVPTSKSPSNETIPSPLLLSGSTIWQLSANIPTTIPTGNTAIISLYNDTVTSTVQCTPDGTTSTLNETWKTNLTDWVPPQFGSTYQVSIYAAPANTPNPQSVGILLPPDGSGNNDGWFFDYQSGVVNFADINIPAAVAGNAIYVVGARYVGPKGVTNFPYGLTMSNLTVTANATVGNIFGTAYYFANGRNILQSLTSYGNANVAAYLPIDPTIIGIQSNITALNSNTASLATVLAAAYTQGNVNSANISVLFSNVAAKALDINSLVTGANANIAAFLLRSTPIVVANNTPALGANTGALQVWGGASIGANLYVGGNLIVQGNTYELQTQIITQSEIVGANISAAAYFWANGTPFNYGNTQVAAYLPIDPTITSIQANVGAYQIATNANLGTATNNINSINANVGAYESYANIQFGNISNALGEILAYEAIANAAITSLYTGANANTAAYLLGGITTGNIMPAADNTYWLGDLTRQWKSMYVSTNTLYIGGTSVSIGLDGLLSVGGSGGLTSYANANVAAYLPLNSTIQAIWANVTAANLAISTLQANVGAYKIYANANAATQATSIDTINANVGDYQITTNANLGVAKTDITALYLLSNSTQSQITSLALGANANTAAYLALPTTNTTIGANLTVNGNLIIKGNTYELQTQIISQSEIVATNLSAAAYFWANGVPFNYGNSQVAGYLPIHAGNISGNYLSMQTDGRFLGNVYAADFITYGSSANVSGINYISANNFIFAQNGASILNSLTSYSNVNVAAYLTGTISVGNILTTNGLFYANGVNALTAAYSNVQVSAYLPTHAGNISSNNTFVSNNVITKAAAGTGVIAGNLAPIVNNPYNFSGTYSLSTTTATAQNTSGNVALQLGGTSFCVQFWFYLTSAPTSNPIVFGKDQLGAVEYYGTISPTGIYFSTSSGLATGGTYGFTPQINTWYHVAWTSDGTNYRIYLNGRSNTPSPVAGNTITNNTGPLTVGSSTRLNNFFTGYIEDFRIDKGTPVYNTNFNTPFAYIGTTPTTVFYLKTWTAGAGLSTTVDAANNFNIQTNGGTSPATLTTAAPYTGTFGQGVLYDGVNRWYTTDGFTVQSTISSTSTSTGALQVLGGAGIAGNLYAGNITANLITSTGNVVSGNVLANNFYYANGNPYIFGSTYGDSNVVALFSNVNSGVTANIISLGVPKDGSLTANAAYTGWTPVTKVTDAIDNLNQMALNIAQNTFVGGAQFSANILAGASPLTINFTGTTVGNPNAYLWNFGDGNTSTAGATVTKTYANASGGTFTVSYTAYNTNGTLAGNAALGAVGDWSTATQTNYITLYTPTPIPSFTTNVALLNSGSAVRLTDTSQFASTYVIYWGDGTTTTNLTPGGSATHTYNTAAGTDTKYSIILSATSPTAGPSPVTVNSASTVESVYSSQTASISVPTTRVINGASTVTFNNTTSTNPGAASLFGIQQYYQFNWGDGGTVSAAIGSGAAGDVGVPINHIYSLTSGDQANGITETFRSNLYIYTGNTYSPFTSSNVTITVEPQVRSTLTVAAVTASDRTGDTTLTGYIFTDYNGRDRSLFSYTANSTQNATNVAYDYGDSVTTGNILTGNPGFPGFAALTHSYLSAGTGTKTVSLTSYGTPGTIAQSNTATKSVVISANPTAPTALSGLGLTLSSGSVGTSPFLAAGATDNTSGNISSAGSLVTRYVSTTPILTNNIVGANTSTAGTLVALVNNSIKGTVNFSVGTNTTGTYSSLVIDNDGDAHNLISASVYPSGFYKVFNAHIAQPLSGVSLGYNDMRLLHSLSGSTNKVNFVVDDETAVPTLVTSGVTVANVATAGATIRYISGIPYYQSGGNVVIQGLQVYNWIGQTYQNTTTPFTISANATLAEGTSGTLFSSQTKTYSQLNGTTNYLTAGIPNANTGNVVANTYTFGNLYLNINGTAAAVGGAAVSIQNVNGASSVLSLPTLFNVYSAALSGVIETNIPCTAGSISTPALRIAIPSASGDTPAFADTGTNYYSGNPWSSSSVIVNTDEAVVRWGRLAPNTTNYSTGYLPVGPDLSAAGARTTTQYFRFAFTRSAINSFSITLTGKISGLFIAAPGTAITSASTLNGWLDATQIYAGAGVPGANISNGGNGSNGCALNALSQVAPGTVYTNQTFTLVLGTVSLTGAYGNQCLLNIKLAPGDYITSLSIGS